VKIVHLLLALFYTSLSAQEKPNILWLVSEDNNVNWIGCYGNEFARTPNIDQLAREGFQYLHAYANAPVCAPSRSTWITGMHALSIGTLPMRSFYEIPHKQIPYYPDLLKQAGYYCVNPGKTDYNIGLRKDRDCWEAGDINFQTLKQKQPFFAVFNTNASHEHKAFTSESSSDPAKTKLQSYHPDLPEIRANYAAYQDAITKMDGIIGQQVRLLEKAGLADNTIVIYCSDHGGVLPRSKRFLFNSGTHSPLIIRIPEQFRSLWPAATPGSKVDRLISFVDMPATWLKLAGAPVPSHMQGQPFLGESSAEERQWHLSYRARMDERLGNSRALRNKNFLYIRNYMPWAPRGQRLNYGWKLPAMQAWSSHCEDEQKGDKIQQRFFAPCDSEELYDTSKDPDNTNNLLQNPEYREVLQSMRRELSERQKRFFDSALIPESELFRLSQVHEKSIYHIVRDPQIYPIADYLQLAETALQKNVDNTDLFFTKLNHPNIGIRYWAAAGLLLIADKTELSQQKLKNALKEDSHEVRALLAWTLYKSGDKQTAFTTINEMLEDSYTPISLLNLIDWIGETAPFAKTILTMEHHSSAPVQTDLWLARLKFTLGLTDKAGNQALKRPKKQLNSPK
jgi:arylsulfatase A-like enzyme